MKDNFKFLKKKKGELSIVVLVLGVFVICSLALLTFYVSLLSIKDSFFGVGLVEKMNSQIEGYALNHNLNQINHRKNYLGEDVAFQEEIETHEILFWKKDELVFSVERPIG